MPQIGQIVVFGVLIIAILGYVYFKFLGGKVSEFPKNVGCASSEYDFCICDGEGKPPTGCKTCTPTNLNTFGGSFARSIEEGVKGKYKYVGVASLPNSDANPNEGYWFGFNEISSSFKPFENAGCNVPCRDTPTQKCGCADKHCPANTQRAWSIFETGAK